MLNRDISSRTPDLLETFALLARHTRKTAPAFGPPATGEAPATSAPAPSPPLATMASVRREPPADPRAPTLLSQPIASSVTVTTGRRTLAGRRSPAFALLFLGVIGAAVAGTVWLLGGSSPAPAASVSPPLPPPAAAAPEPAPEAKPLPLSSTVASAAPAVTTATKRSLPAPKPVSRAGSQRAGAAVRAAAPKPADAELAFPGGRK
jgi:hypothetical protein